MRIITGKYKGRHFDIPRTFKARPTTDFAKENIFNVLTQYIDFEGAEALDLFSGTGSITLELLSRGCSHVVSVELDRDHHRFILDCLKKLQGEKNVQSSMFNVQCLRADVFRYIKSCKQQLASPSSVTTQDTSVKPGVRSTFHQFDFIFADPPYALKELHTIPSLIFEHRLLKDNGIFVFEHGKDHDFSDDPHFVEHRSYGSVNFSIFRIKETTDE